MTNLLLAIRNILLTNTVQAMLNGGELFVHASKDAGDVVITAHDQACEFLKRWRAVTLILFGRPA